MPSDRPSGAPPVEEAVSEGQHTIREMIKLPRVTIVEETNGHYLVKFEDEYYWIADETVDLSVEMEDEVLDELKRVVDSVRGDIADDRIDFLDSFEVSKITEEVPREFIEMQIFVQLRTLLHHRAGYDGGLDEDDLVNNDAILYALKYFSPEMQAKYWLWAKKRQEIEQQQRDEDQDDE